MSDRGKEPRPSHRRRWQETILLHLADFPRQYAALENAMKAFGGRFSLQQFKEAYNTTDDMVAYNRVQAVERAAGPVQNFVTELAITGVKLSQLPHPSMRKDGSEAQQAFEALRNAGVIGDELCAQLTDGQTARTRLEHTYVEMPAGDVHRAARVILEAARNFIGPYRAWITPYMKDHKAWIQAEYEQ